MRGIIMTSIIMVKDLLNEERVKTLAYVLDNAGIQHEIHLSQSVVLVDGDNDVIRKAKQMISENGCEVI